MLRLFLPEICVHCGEHCDYSKQESLSKYLCNSCFRQFYLFEPPTQDNLTAKSSLFRELPFEVQIGSSFIFQNGGIIQSLIHHAKYMDMPNLAKILGKIAAGKNADISKEYDVLIPVPLHRTRYSERGYNQSEMLAIGIGDPSKISIAKKSSF